MADFGWGQGRPAETDTGIVHVLTAYATQGGQLFGARRWAENPLTLTHVRWQGPGGQVADAFREPGNDLALSEDERQVWVQLALHFPTSHPGVPGTEAPWLPLSVERDNALQWANQLRQAQSARRMASQSSSGPGGFSRPRSAPMEGAAFSQPGTGSQYAVPGSSGAPFQPQRSSVDAYGARSPMSVPQGGFQTSPQPAAGAAQTPGAEDGRQWTSGFQASVMDSPEVTVLPCIEVELPPLLDGPAGADYRRDFSRDVAMHFGRAAHAIPQVREVRGWMRGDRLVLAARFVVAAGVRTPTRAEMDGAAQILADMLARRTLPYSRLIFADPGEWMQGAPLPE